MLSSLIQIVRERGVPTDVVNRDAGVCRQPFANLFAPFVVGRVERNPQ
jgi:hypothetical protein